MLQVRRTQMRVLEDAGWRKFEDEMLLHSEHVAPKLSTQLGEGQLRIARRVLKLAMPKQTKTVALDEPGFPAFEMVASAVKFTAGIAVPEALNHRFFPNL